VAAISLSACSSEAATASISALEAIKSASSWASRLASSAIVATASDSCGSFLSALLLVPAAAVLDNEALFRPLILEEEEGEVGLLGLVELAVVEPS
jgi:hypothetical protein